MQRISKFPTKACKITKFQYSSILALKGKKEKALHFFKSKRETFLKKPLTFRCTFCAHFAQRRLTGAKVSKPKVTRLCMQDGLISRFQYSHLTKMSDIEL